MTVLQKCKSSLQYYEVYGALAAGNYTYFMCDNAHLYVARICCFFKLKKRSHCAVPLDVWVPRKFDREAISGCLQLPSRLEIFMDGRFYWTCVNA